MKSDHPQYPMKRAAVAGSKGRRLSYQILPIATPHDRQLSANSVEKVDVGMQRRNVGV